MKTVRCVSLGCPKNLVDTEVMLRRLAEAGYRVIDEKSPGRGKADICLVNTCCFIREAEAESLDVIRQAVRLKGRDANKVIVAGCLAQRYPERIRKLFGNKVDAVLGVFERDRIGEVCHHLDGVVNAPVRGGSPLSNPTKSCPRSGQSYDTPVGRLSTRNDVDRVRITPAHYAYLRIAEGCNNRCAYCVIPDIHGAYRSKPFELVLKEAKALVQSGAIELNIIAQDTTSYNYRSKTLSDLLRALSRIDQVKWLRLLYTHPAHWTDELIATVAELPKVVKYVDLPIQHISDRVLKLMHRHVTGAEIRRLISKLRDKIPGLFIRSTVIVGFPGERESDFQELLGFLREVEFERLGAFRYSREPNTRAAGLAGQVMNRAKQARFDAVMSVQQVIAFGNNKKLVGKNVEIIIDGISKNIYIGRTYGDAPEVDGSIFVKCASPNGEKSARRWKPGDIVRARVTGSKGYDLVGQVLRQSRYSQFEQSELRRGYPARGS